MLNFTKGVIGFSKSLGVSLLLEANSRFQARAFFFARSGILGALNV